MKQDLIAGRASGQPGQKQSVRSVYIIVAVGALAVLLGWLWKPALPTDGQTEAAVANGRWQSKPGDRRSPARQIPVRPHGAPAISPEADVAARLAQFTRNRREIARRLAEKLGIALPPDVERFFDAAESGDIDLARQIYQGLDFSEDARQLRPVVLETFGVHEAVHDWPAQALLDYGHSILGSLEPGMVYLGGTDPGRFIPTLLNETSGGEPRVILTQNALADATYLSYVEFLYGDRLNTLTGADGQRAFSDYLADAQKRFEHDQQLPNEPKQMRPGENIKVENGRVVVSGTGAVMAINERLLQTLVQNNPELPFAMEESFALPSTYPGAKPLGPILALNASPDSAPVTVETANESLDHWQRTAARFFSDPDASINETVGQAYASMIAAQGNLFSSQNHTAQAEQAYRLAQQLAPRELKPVADHARLLGRTGRTAEAATILDAFARSNPEKGKSVADMKIELGLR